MLKANPEDAMLELLIACVQITCLVGYLYGGYIVVKHASGFGSPEAARSRYAPRPDSGHSALLQKYLAYD